MRLRGEMGSKKKKKKRWHSIEFFRLLSSLFLFFLSLIIIIIIIMLSHHSPRQDLLLDRVPRGQAGAVDVGERAHPPRVVASRRARRGGDDGGDGVRVRGREVLLVRGQAEAERVVGLVVDRERGGVEAGVGLLGVE